VERDRRPDAPDVERRESLAHPPDGIGPGAAVDDDLRDEGIVHRGNLGATLDPRVHPDPGPPGFRVRQDAARGGEEPVDRILRIDPALERVPAEPDVRWRDFEVFARRDEELLSHEVYPCDQLGHGVLHLEPGVHLVEREPSFVEEELDRAGVRVSQGAKAPEGSRPDLLPLPGGQRGGRRLLDELLVPSLDGALSFPENDPGAPGAEDRQMVDYLLGRFVRQEGR